jgi:alkylhydroperoxidase family enzyme
MREERDMSNHRIPLLSDKETAERVEELGLHDAIGKLNIFRTMLHRPHTAKAISDLLFSLLLYAELDDRSRELLIMRIGWQTKSDYEWTQHWTVAKDIYACPEADLIAVRDWKAAKCFSEKDQTVLSATDELLETGALSDKSWDQCVAALGRDASIDLVAAVGTWSMISTIARGLRIPLEEGVASWPPDGTSPTALGR